MNASSQSAMALVLPAADLVARGSNTLVFEGAAYGAGVSFFDVNVAPGAGAALHYHPYAETWIIHAGSVEMTLGDDIRRLDERAVVVVPAGMVHGFTNVGDKQLRMSCIHASDRFTTVWLDE